MDVLVAEAFRRLLDEIEASNHSALNDLLTTYDVFPINIFLNNYYRTMLASVAAFSGQTECLRVIAARGFDPIGVVSENAVRGGQLACLRLARELDDQWPSSVVAQSAASRGHIDCLNYLIEHNCPIDDGVLHVVINGGHLDSVRLLVDRELPVADFFFWPTNLDGGQFRPDQRQCILHLLDRGRLIHPGTLIWAARGGDVDSVRLLHSKGVGLWKSACKEEDPHFGNFALSDHLEHKVIAIPQAVEHAEGVLKSLHYGWAQGAPVTPAVEAAFRAKRAATRAILLCFRAAYHLSLIEGGPGDQRATYGPMGAVPLEVIEKILLCSEFEIDETLRRRLPEPCIRNELETQPPLEVWKRNDHN